MTNRSERAARGEQSHGNILDFFLILLLLASLVGIFYRYYALSDSLPEGDTGNYVLYFTADGVDARLPRAFAKQAAVYLPDGTRVGRLNDQNGDVWSDTALALTPARMEIDGNAVLSPADYLVDVTGAIVVSGTNGESGFLLGGTLPIAPGERLTICTDAGILQILVTEIRSQ